MTYVRSLSRVASGDAGAALAGDASRGEQLFFGEGQCSSCHEISGRGSLLAPDLSESGKQPAAAIRTAIEHPGRPFGPSPRHVKVTLRDGTQLDGVIKNEDSFAVVLQSFDGEYRLLGRRQIRTIDSAPAAIVPATLAQRLSADQKADLVAYLSLQKRRAAVTSISPKDAGLSFDRLSRAEREPHNWPTYWGSYRAEHFSELTQIHRRNVSTLQARWAAPLPGSSPLEATPLVVDGIMYVSGSPGDVYALDARSGLGLWRFHREQQRVNPFQINPYNKGVAVLGKRVFVNTLDNNLIALDARSGRVLWEQNIADTMDGYTMTGAPLVLDDKVIVGISGGEMDIRGFISAYDARDGPFAVAVRHHSRSRPARARDLARRLVENRRRRDVAHGKLRHGVETPLLGRGQSGPRLRSGESKGRQPLQLLRARARPEHGPSRLALPVFAARHARLGFDGGHDPRRRAARWAGAQGAPARRSQRFLLHARSSDRRVHLGGAVRAANLEQGLRAQRTADLRSRIALDAGRASHLAFGRRHELSGTFLRSAAAGAFPELRGCGRLCQPMSRPPTSAARYSPALTSADGSRRPWSPRKG